MQITNYLEQYTGMTALQLLDGDPPLVEISMITDVDGKTEVSFPRWSVTGKSAPTSEMVLRAMELDEPIPVLAAMLVSRASDVGNLITGRVVPDALHQNAYLIAMNIVASNGGSAPTSDPQKTEFDQMAMANGQSSEQFAALVMVVQTMGLRLATAIAVLRSNCSSATSKGDLLNTLNAYETSIEQIVKAISATGISIEMPPSIVVPGLNDQ